MFNCRKEKNVGVRRRENCSLKTNERLITASQHNAGRRESAHVTPLVQINNSSAPALCRLAVYTFVELLACPGLLFSLGARGPCVVLWRMKGKKDFDKRKLLLGPARCFKVKTELGSSFGIRHTGVRLKVKSKNKSVLILPNCADKTSPSALEGAGA